MHQYASVTTQGVTENLISHGGTDAIYSICISKYNFIVITFWWRCIFAVPAESC